MYKYFLVSLYLLCTSWYHKLLSNNRWTIPVALLFPKIDVVSPFWICQYFPNRHFSGSSCSASQHALSCAPVLTMLSSTGAGLLSHTLLPWGVTGQVLLCLSHQQSLIQRQHQTPAQESATIARCTSPFYRKAQSPINAAPLCMEQINAYWGQERAQEWTCHKARVTAGEFVHGETGSELCSRGRAWSAAHPLTPEECCGCVVSGSPVNSLSLPLGV